MVTLALRRSRFSSCRALHLSLNVSSSILSTLFSCCSEARRFVSSSRRNCEMTMLGLPELDAEDDIGVAELLPAPSVSLSLALSAMAVRQCGRGAGGRDDATSCGVREAQTAQRSHRVTLRDARRHSAPGRFPPELHPRTDETGAIPYVSTFILEIKFQPGKVCSLLSFLFTYILI